MIAKIMHRSCILSRKKFKNIIKKIKLKTGKRKKVNTLLHVHAREWSTRAFRYVSLLKLTVWMPWGVTLNNIKTLHSFGKGKTLKVIKIVRKLQWTQEPQYIPTCTGTTLSVSNLLSFFSQNLGGRWFTVCIVTNQKLKQQAVKYYDQGLPAAIYMQ